MNRKLFLFCLMLVLAACQATIPPAPTPTLTPEPTLTPTPIPPSPTPFPDPFVGKIKLGGYERQITCYGTGVPTIILENGLDNVSWLTTHLQNFSSISRTCLYPRLGQTPETSNPPGPRTIMDVVKELHALLQQTGVPGPYILVGHSFAGCIMLVYTSQYPDEVVGLVCADCAYITPEDIFLEKLKPELDADPNFVATLGFDPRNTPETPNPEAWKDLKEHIDFTVSDKQTLAVTSLGDRPLIVLLASDHPMEMDPRFVKAWQAAWYETSIRLSELSTQSRVEIVKGTDHLSILWDPAVGKAIKEVYDKVKQE